MFPGKPENYAAHRRGVLLLVEKKRTKACEMELDFELVRGPLEIALDFLLTLKREKRTEG